MNSIFASRFPQGPITWITALTSVGLAILAAGPASGTAAEHPGKVRVVSHTESELDDAEAVDDSADPSVDADDGRDADARDKDAGDKDAGEEDAVSMRIADDELDDDDEDVGRAQVARPMPEQPAPKKVELSRATIRIQDAARVAPPPVIRRPTSVQKPAPKAHPAARPSHVNPTARQYPFERAASFARPARPSRTVAAKPETAVRPVQHESGPQQSAQHQSGQRSPFLADDESEEEGDDLNDEMNSAPATFVEETEAEANPPVGKDDCPPVTEAEIKSFVEQIETVTKRKPISALRADLKIQLPKEQSGLIDDDGRNAARESARCSIEHDRALVRQYLRAKYGPGFDRSSGGYRDDNLAPEFPFCYLPLYFEDPNLERCGYSLGCCAQPFVSGLQFYGNVAILPFKMLLIHPLDYVYPQDDCEPCTRYSYRDNFLGPCPESTGWGMFRSRGFFGNRRCR